VLAYNLAYIGGFFHMYLKKIGRTFYYYSRVPKDLTGLLGYKELKKSLKTTDRRAANTAAKAYALELERLGVYVRTGIMDDMQLQRALQRFKDSFLLGVEGHRDVGASMGDVLEEQAFSNKPIEGINPNTEWRQLLNLFGTADEQADPSKAVAQYTRLIDAIRTELRSAIFSDETRRGAKRFILDNALDVELPPPGWFDENDDLWFEPVKGNFLKVCRKFLQTKMEMYGVEIDRLQDNYDNPYDVKARNRRPPFLLSEAIEQFCQWRQREKPVKERTQQRYREYFNVMLAILGDRDVTEYSRKDLESLKEELFKRPANLTKNPKEIRLLDKRSIMTNYMGKIKALFQWLNASDYIDKDFTHKLVTSLTAKEKKERKRSPYDHDDLKKIFDLLPFDKKQAHLAWVPLIAAYSGCRQGEIAQLLVTDIKEAHGIPYLHITEEDDEGNIVKTVKNENSKRLVPLHPVIVDLGFLEFVKMKKSQGKKVLFETSKHTPLTGQYYSKRFQPFNRKHVTKDPKKVFHSFRHLVHNELKQKMVPPDVYHSITGHVAQHEMDQVYTEDYKLQTKYDALVLLGYPSIDLERLKEKFSIFKSKLPCFLSDYCSLKS
jgi:integrase